MKETILELQNITKIFPGVKALDKVQLDIRKGEVHALIGENGAGKSTLMNVILGTLQAEAGTIRFKGEEVHFKSPTDALNAGISMIHQEISLVQTMDIAENVWLGREDKFRKFGLLDLKARYKATKDLLEKLGLGFLDPKMTVKNLSIANQQLVEIARAVSNNSDVIIMDEPTSSLTQVEIDLLYKIIRDLSSNGVAIIFISHKLEEIFDICERVTVFRDGQYIITKDVADITNAELIKYIIGRDLSNMYPKVSSEIKEPVLEVKHLTREGVFEDISFNVRAGEILGFSGLVGAGRTEIMRSIFGADPLDSGEIYINGQQVHIRNPKDAIQSGIGMVTEDRRLSGSIYALSVMANTTLAAFDDLCNPMGFYSPKAEEKAFNEAIEKIAVKYSDPKEKISQLSGGNQQKVIIARWLMAHPKVLILDEPTRGIDIGSKSEIYKIMSELAREGMAIIMVSSELPEILGASDRIMVVREGKIVHECLREDATQESLISYAFGQEG